MWRQLGRRRWRGCCACAIGRADESGCIDHRRRAPIEVDLAPIAEGQAIKVFWRGKPIYVTHRTKKEIDEARAVNVATLPDPETDEKRVKAGHEEWQVLIGICTHLGAFRSRIRATSMGSSAPAMVRNTTRRDASVGVRRRTIFRCRLTNSYRTPQSVSADSRFPNLQGSNMSGQSTYQPQAH